MICRLLSVDNSACGVLQYMHADYHGFKPFIFCLTVIIPVVNLLGYGGKAEQAEAVIKIKIIDFAP